MLSVRIINPSLFSSISKPMVYSSTSITSVLGQYRWHTSCRVWTGLHLRRSHFLEMLGACMVFTRQYIIVYGISYPLPSHLSSLHKVTEHDNHSTLPVMNHLPEISDCGLHGTLSNNEGFLLLVTLHDMNYSTYVGFEHGLLTFTNTA